MRIIRSNSACGTAQPWTRYLLALLISLSIASSSYPAGYRNELLRLVPEDMAFCLILENLRDHGNALVDSPFLKQFTESKVGQSVIKSEETDKLTILDQYLKQALEITATQLRDEILGDELVFAYRSGPPGNAGQEQGLLLLRARNPNLLTELVQRLNTLQKGSGDLKELAELEFSGKKYFKRTEKSGASFYYLNGPVFVFASTEETMQQVLASDKARSRTDEAPLTRQFRLMGIDNPLAALWINPRAFDAELQHKLTTSSGSEAVALAGLQHYWKALDGIAISVVLQKNIELQLALRARTAELPAAMRRFLQVSAAPADLWSRFPEQTIFSLAARTDIAAFLGVLADFLPKESRKQMLDSVNNAAATLWGPEALRKLLPDIGPDWGFCLLAPAADRKGWIPDALLAVRIQKGDPAAPADLTVLDALQSLATLAVVQRNGMKPGSLSLKLKVHEGITIRYIDGGTGFPPGFQPAFALRDGFVLVASSPAALLRFKPNSQVIKAGASNQETPMLRLSMRQVESYLSENHDALTSFISEKNQLSKETAGSGLEKLRGALQFFDQIELAHKAEDGRLILSFRVRMSQPLK